MTIVQNRVVLALLWVALVATSAGVGRASAARPAAGSNPVIASVAPAVPRAGDRAQDLVVNGSDLLEGLTLEILDPAGAATVISGRNVMDRRNTSFRVSVALAAPGTYSLKVTNTDGGVSDPFALEVAERGEAPAAPRIDRVTPAEPVHHPEPQSLRVDGQRFENGLTATLTTPVGETVGDVVIDRLTPTSFRLTARLGQSGRYELVVVSASGATSNVAVIPVR